MEEEKNLRTTSSTFTDRIGVGTISERCRALRERRRALLATNFYNLETLQGVLWAAAKQRAPIILQMTRATIDYIQLPVAVAMARAASKDLGVEAWLHLDHGDSVELAARCLDAGFDSVMIDASERTFAENIDISRQVVQLAQSYGAAVEAELGYVAKLGQDKERVAFTDPRDAELFVNETGVDWLAIAVGNAHGFYKGEPAIDLTRISEIAAATHAILVLHGSSGIPDAQLIAAIDAGITKINLATEIKHCFMQTLRTELQSRPGIDLREMFPVSTRGVATLVESKLQLFAQRDAQD